MSSYIRARTVLCKIFFHGEKESCKHTVNSLLDLRSSASTRDCKPAAVEIVIQLAIINHFSIVNCMWALQKVFINRKLFLVTPTSINWTIGCNGELLTV